ncbi:SsrA-binding protein SmpB [Candidatus Peregrinibacteria bacterium]|nr:SsrA-binding protein SmpB [Candidatus Peregrinibacteria bacterium]
MKIITKNKKAYFDYEVLEEFKTGIVLTGPEVKSVRDGHIDLKGAFVSILGDEVFLKNANIVKYPCDTTGKHESFRERKLLLTKREIAKITKHLNTAGTTIVPLAVGLEKCYIKFLIGVARGKKQYDKRQSIKEKDVKRRIDRAIRKHF